MTRMGLPLSGPRALASRTALLASVFVFPAYADDVLRVHSASLDPPTVVTLGAKLLVTGDDNFNASVAVRYRQTGTNVWRDGLPFFRVHPEHVSGMTVAAQFAGSIFDLTPETSYDIELHAVDPDGSVDQTVSLTGMTRAVPRNPTNPNVKNVTDAGGFDAALQAAQPGDVITLANGVYSGNFSFRAGGTTDNPIVIRGASEDGVILDGGGCTGCNVLEAYGSFVHVENLTIAHASRALRFQGSGSEANVVRYVHFKDVILGIGSNPDQRNYYICDNILEGRLAWPAVYTDDGGAHANDDGIHVQGNGHVICHNRLIGFGDALKIEQDGARAIDFYGNEVLSAYDNALEMDGSAGNVRAFRNRFTNTYATLSYQPVFGGPTYTFRNVVVNVVNEQMKFHNETSGNLVFHNTFVSPGTALGMHDSTTSHHFVIQNNLFVTASSASGRTMDWTGTIDDGVFDYDGFFPDGVVDFHYAATGYTRYDTFAEARAAHPQFEPHGLLLTAPIFANGLTAPADYTTALQPQDVTLASGSNAIDKGLVLSNLNDGFTGAGPDLGAFETGCAIPIYGPRAVGTDETNEPIGCGSPVPDGGAGGSSGSGGATGGGGTSSAGTAGTAGSTSGAGGTSAGASGAGAASGTNGNAGTNGGGTNGGGGNAGTSGAAATPSADSGDSGGCGCRTSRSGESNGAAALALAFALLWRRRRESNDA
jgi:MYXO-CTERM domain-containing protein